MSVFQRLGGYWAVALMAMAVLLHSVAVKAQNFLYNVSEVVAGNEPAGVILDDFNRDGRIDLAVANYGDNTVSIFMGASGEKFAPKVNYATGAEPTGLVAADLRGTGKLDIVTVNIGSGGVDAPGSVSVLLGNGNGTFQKHVDYPVGNYPTGVVADDFNGDGKLDLAVSNAYSNTVSILFGNGDGTFQSQVAITVGNQPMSIAVGDFNGDGKLDLVTSCVESGVLSVLLSKGDGGFTRLDSSFGAPGPGDVVIAVGDFNRDGKLDVAISEPLSLLMGNGDGTFQAPVAIPSSGVNRITTLVARDFNQDGKLDLAADSLSGLAVLLGKGDGRFQAPILSPVVGPNTTPPGSIAFADVNGDGRLDVAATLGDLGAVSLLLGMGNGSFAVPKNVYFTRAVNGPDASVVADFNGDGKPDIAVAEVGFPHGNISVLLGTGRATFGKPVISPIASQAINNQDKMLVGDFNGDGRPDLIVMDDYANGFQVLLGNGDGSFKAPVDTKLNTNLAFAIGDFNGDGKTDVVVTTIVNAQVQISIYLSNGDGTFRLGVQYTEQYGGVNVADVNGDGKEDLILLNSGPIMVLLGNGNGTFQKAISGPSAVYSGEAVIRDFDGDGKTDIVVGTYSGLAFLKGNGDGTFQAPVYSNSPDYFCCQMSAGDFNGDGKLDLISNLYNFVRVMTGNGDGNFSRLSFTARKANYTREILLSATSIMTGSATSAW